MFEFSSISLLPVASANWTIKFFLEERTHWGRLSLSGDGRLVCGVNWGMRFLNIRPGLSRRGIYFNYMELWARRFLQSASSYGSQIDKSFPQIQGAITRRVNNNQHHSRSLHRLIIRHRGINKLLSVSLSSPFAISRDKWTLHKVTFVDNKRNGRRVNVIYARMANNKNLLDWMEAKRKSHYSFQRSFRFPTSYLTFYDRVSIRWTHMGCVIE